MSSGTRKGRSERGGGKGGAEDGDGEPRPPQPVPPPPPPPPSLAACQCRVALGPKMAAASICLLSREGRGGEGVEGGKLLYGQGVANTPGRRGRFVSEGGRQVRATQTGFLMALSRQVRIRGIRGFPRCGGCRLRAERQGSVRGAGDRGARPRPPPGQRRLQLQQPQ